MGGNRTAWGNTQKQHDDLIRSLRPLIGRIVHALSAISSNLKQVGEQTEKMGRRAAQDSNIEYHGGSPDQLFPFAALDTIIETFGGPRHLMESDEVSFYLSAIRSVLKLSDGNIRESARLAKAFKDNRQCLKKIERFYSMGEKGAGRAARRPRRSAKPKRRR